MKREELDELSAVIDNEAGHEVMIRVSRRISRDEELRNTLVRYQMIGDCLRGETVNPAAMDVVAAVSRRLEKEPTVLAPPPRSNRSRWLQPVAGAAIAASVAAVVVMWAPRFISPQHQERSGSEFRVVAEPAPAWTPAPALVSHEEMHWKTVEEPDEARLDRYLEQHSRYAGQNVLQGMIPFTTLVSYDGTPGVQGR